MHDYGLVHTAQFLTPALDKGYSPFEVLESRMNFILLHQLIIHRLAAATFVAQSKNLYICNQMQVQLHSNLICPHCGFEKWEEMPQDACQFFYECRGCKRVLKPEEGDCCVYCSYGSVPCPPIQMNKSCC